jgi:hypothetical protein
MGRTDVEQADPPLIHLPALLAELRTSLAVCEPHHSYDVARHVFPLLRTAGPTLEKLEFVDPDFPAE